MNRQTPFNPEFKLPWISPVSYQDVPVPRRDWLVDGLIPAHAVTMISGDGGLGKSLLAMQLMTCCALDKQWLGNFTKPVKSIGVFCEDELNELHNRQDAINRHYECQFSDLDNMRWLSRVGEDNTLVQYLTKFEHGERRDEFEESYLISHIENAAYKFGAQLVILDSLHDLYGGQENDRRQARQFIQILRQLAIAINGAVVILAHPSLSGMASGTGSSGSTAWNNAVRSRLYLTKPKASDGEKEDHDARILKTMKANYGAVGGEVRLRYQDGVFVNTRHERNEGGFDARVEERNRERLVLDTIRALAAKKIAISIKPRANNYGPKMIVRAGTMSGYSQKEIDGVMQSLWARGVICEAEIGRGSDRHPIVSVIIREDNGNAEMS